MGHAPSAGLTVTGGKAAIAMLLLSPKGAKGLIEAGTLAADGDVDVDVDVLRAYAAVMDTFDPGFNLVTP